MHCCLFVVFDYAVFFGLVATKVNRREVGSVPIMFGWDGMEMRLSIRILYLLGKYFCVYECILSS